MIAFDSASRRRPSPQLSEFLEDGPPSVFVGFGGMPGRSDLSDVIADAVARTGPRAIVQRGAAGLHADGLGPGVLTVDHVPHDWLFPRVVAVIHHAGATAAA